MAGLSTAVGALPIYFKKEFSKPQFDFGLGFSAGVMLVATFVALLLPSIEASAERFEHHWVIIPTMIGLALGYASIILLHECLPHEHLIKHENHPNPSHISRALLIVLAICLHNVPEGLSVGVGLASDDLSHGLTIGLAIAIQNMPEGLVVAIGLVSAGSSKHKAFFLAFLSGMIEPLAAAVGYFATNLSEVLLPFALAFAGGAMLFVICQEIFPEIFRENHERRSTQGLLLGVILMLSIDYYL